MAGISSRGPAQCVAVSGKYAYVMIGDTGLEIIDISNTNDPPRVGGCALSGQVSSVKLSGEHVFVTQSFTDGTGWSGRLEVINVSPTPQRRSGWGRMLQAAARSWMWRFQASTAYAVGGYWDEAAGVRRDGLVVINISDPTNPRRESALDTQPYGTFAITVSGSHAYVAHGLQGLQVFDISNPADPNLLRSVGGAGYGCAGSVAVSGHLAYLGILSTVPMAPCGGRWS